jgi:hypothetical protein
MELEILVFGILILMIIGFLVLTFIPIPFTSLNVEAQGPFSLNSSINIFYSEDFLNKSSSTIQGFFYINEFQKTGITTPCSSTDPSLPNCDSGLYSLCACSNTNCSMCGHQGYVPLMNINDMVVLEVLGSPDSSRQNKAAIQLTIKTQSSGLIQDVSKNSVNPSMNPVGDGSIDAVSQLYIETFILPPIPYQKWLMISISRDGRRFDVYYNDTLVLSKYASANVYNEITNTNISIGNTTINGKSGFFNLYKSIQSAMNISSQYNSFINTRGSPLFNTPPPTLTFNEPKSNLSLSIGVPNIPSFCSSTNCIQSPQTPPAKPYYEWSSSYA